MRQSAVILAIGALGLAACVNRPAPGGPALPDQPSTTPPPTATVPGDAGPAWSSLGAQGRLLIAQLAQGVSTVDLATGEVRNLYRPPDPSTSWVNAASASPDGSQILIAYAPPPAGDQVQYGYTRLYLIPADGSGAPQPYLVPEGDQEFYFDPNWSPLGDSLTYAHLVHFSIPNTTPQQYGFKYTIERVSYPGGVVQTLAENGFWPRLSQDGQRLVYVSMDPTLGRLSRWCAMRCAPTRSQYPCPMSSRRSTCPLFTPDGQSLLLSVVTQGLGEQRPGSDPTWLGSAAGG